MRTLVYVGANHGVSLAKMMASQSFDKVYAFEPVPSLAAALRDAFRGRPEVEIVEAACSDRDGMAEFNLSSNHHQSASLGTLKPNSVSHVWHTGATKVRTVNLGSFLKARGVERIDVYVSDAQGMDLTILRTLTEFLAQQRVGQIQAEVTKDQHGNMYDGLPPNNMSAFRELLEPHGYELVGTGWEVLEPGVFDEVPDTWWEFDTVWLPRGHSLYNETKFGSEHTFSTSC